ncbi:MAG: hypothetical protein ACO1O6_07360 [Bacteroidota bacterium]
MANKQKDRLSEERLSSKNPKQDKSQQGLERESSEDMRRESSNKGRL